MRGRHALKNLERILLRSGRLRGILSRYPVARRIYLATLATSFSRESRGVIAGLVANRTTALAQTQSRLSYYSLRRQVHRLEKGLISSPRRDVFAADYAPQVVAALAADPTYWRKTDPDLYHWAMAVLSDYFDVVDYSRDIALLEARHDFLALKTRHHRRAARRLRAVPRRRSPAADRRATTTCTSCSCAAAASAGTSRPRCRGSCSTRRWSPPPRPRAPATASPTAS